MAEREEAPFPGAVIAERNTGIVLDDGGAAGEDIIPDRGEVAGVQQVRRALDQAVARRKRRTEFQETAGPDPGVGKIGREIIQGLFDPVAAGKCDPRATRRVRRSRFGNDRPVDVQRDRRDGADRLARAGQEHIEDRQGAVDLAGAQIGFHLLGDEKAEAQDRTQRTLDAVECRANATARQFREIRHRARRLQCAQHIGRCLAVERVGVEEVRPRKHVEHGRPRCGQIDVRPGADLRQLPLLELRERRIEEFGVALPGRISGQRRQRRVGRRHHAGEKSRGVVRGRGVGGADRKQRREQHHRRKGRHLHRGNHVHSRAADAATGP